MLKLTAQRATLRLQDWIFVAGEGQSVMDEKLNSTALSTEKCHPMQTEVTEWKPMTDLLSQFAFNEKKGQY